MALIHKKDKDVSRGYYIFNILFILIFWQVRLFNFEVSRLKDSFACLDHVKSKRAKFTRPLNIMMINICLNIEKSFPRVEWKYVRMSPKFNNKTRDKADSWLANNTSFCLNNHFKSHILFILVINATRPYMGVLIESPARLSQQKVEKENLCKWCLM